MTLSYARQQQLDNAVKNFVEGLHDPRLLEFIDEPVDSFVNTAAYKDLLQWLGEDEDNQQKSTTMYKGQPTNFVPSVDTAKPCVSVRQEMSHMAPMHTNVAGGKQSHITRDYTLIPQEALASLARVMYNGAMKYSKDNWKLIHKRDHLNHALNHINLYLAGNVNEDHLAHAATRMMMALELDLTEVNDDA